MRFLRRPKEHQDELRIEDSTKQSKKTRKQIHEDEVSAYFSRPLPPEKQVGLPRPDVSRTQALKQSAPQRPPELDHGPPQHPVELPEKPFLGFGSRGPPQEAVESQPPSNSYYTWSESVLAKNSPAAGRPAIPAFKSGTHSERRDQQPSQVSNTSLPRRKASLAKPQQNQSEAEGGRWLESRRTKAPALVEVYQPTKRAHRRNISVMNESSEPLPRVVHVSRDPQLEEMNNRWEVGSYHTSDILKIRETIEEAGQSSSLPARGGISKATAEKESHNTATSTPTSDRLRHAFDAVATSRIRTAPQIPTRPTDQSPEEHSRVVFDASLVPGAQLREPFEAAPSPPRWQMPQRGFSRTSDATRSQARPPTRLGTAIRPRSQREWQTQSIELPRQTGHLNEVCGEEMLDVPSDAPLLKPQHSYVRNNTREAEALMRRLASDQEFGVPREIDTGIVAPSFNQNESLLYQQQRTEPEETFEPNSFAPELFSFYSQQLGGQSSGEQFQSEQYAVDGFQGEEEVDNDNGQVANPDLAGFWRPNILY